eukprot:TRINITY_DN26608_c0_g1_i3.p1 TRINITY_DN26608_c0_g1~~TRINITY_DN26608_c0_g1_i3.p1  ORF type:complete len:681 (+),score=89.85 TRINITY_DN26608_c0_g1_i3:65-2044(+)
MSGLGAVPEDEPITNPSSSSTSRVQLVTSQSDPGESSRRLSLSHTSSWEEHVSFEDQRSAHLEQGELPKHKKRRRFLHKSLALVVLGAYHACCVFAAFVIAFTTSVNFLLAWFIEWFNAGEKHGVKGLLVGMYLATLLRSYLLSLFVGRLCQVASWLMRDALLPDAFLVYRQFLCLGAAEVLASAHEEEDVIAKLGIPGACKRPPRVPDVLVQIAIWGSFDIFPPLMAAVAWFNNPSYSVVLTEFSFYSCVVGVVHVSIFYIFELVNDVIAKYNSWQTVKCYLNVAGANPPPPSISVSRDFVMDGLEIDRVDSSGLPGSSNDSASGELLGLRGSRSVGSAELLPVNVCAAICSILQPSYKIIIVTWVVIGSLIYGFVRLVKYGDGGPIILALLAFGTCLFMMFGRTCSRRIATSAIPYHCLSRCGSFPLFSQSWTEFGKLMQRWGDRHCSISEEHNAPQLDLLELVLLLQAILFRAIRWFQGVELMFVIALIVLVRRLLLGFTIAMHIEWFVFCMEKLLYFTTLFVLQGVCLTGWYVFGAFLLSVLLLFSFQRHYQRGSRVYLGTTFALQALVVGIVGLSTSSIVQTPEDFSNFCEEGDPECKYWTPSQQALWNEYPHRSICDMHFPLGPHSSIDAGAYLTQTDWSQSDISKQVRRQGH